MEQFIPEKMLSPERLGELKSLVDELRVDIANLKKANTDAVNQTVKYQQKQYEAGLKWKKYLASNNNGGEYGVAPDASDFSSKVLFKNADRLYKQWKKTNDAAQELYIDPETVKHVQTLLMENILERIHLLQQFTSLFDN